MFFLLYLFGLLFINKNIHIYSVKDRFCVNCKHFINIPGCSDKFGKCRLFPSKVDNYNTIDYLVSGKRKLEYRPCNFVREDEESCGITGRYYEKRMLRFPKLKDFKNKFCLFVNNDVNNNINSVNLDKINIENSNDTSTSPIIKKIYSYNNNLNKNSDQIIDF